jgi:hypothetical protein
MGADVDLELQAQGPKLRRTVFPRGLANSTAAFSMTVVVLGSPFGPQLDADLFVGPYSGSAPTVWELSNSATLFQQAVEV